MTHTLVSGWTVAVCIAATCFLSACALTSKAELVQIRYFSPERARPEASQQRGTPAETRNSGALRLGRVSSGPNLRERIAYRDAPYELGYYDDLRWTERPEIYVRRALDRALFEMQGLRHAIGGSAPTLDVEVIAFDDLRLQFNRAARVQLRATLYDDTEVRLERTFTLDRAVSTASPQIEDFVAAMALALDAATDAVATQVKVVLATQPVVNAQDASPARIDQ